MDFTSIKAFSTQLRVSAAPASVACFTKSLRSFIGGIVTLAIFLSHPAAAQLCATSGATLIGPDLSQFGNSLALSANGNTAIVGSWKENRPLGAAHVYVRTGSTWSPQGPALVATEGSGTDQYFGSSVSISADGNTALVGAYYDSNGVGAAYVFVRTGNVWTQQGPKLVPTGGIGSLQFFGISCALSADGSTAIIGAWQDNAQIGAAYVFVRSAGVWTQQGPKFVPPVGGGGYYGVSVSLSADGNTAAIGAALAHKAFIYTRSGQSWAQQGPALTPTGAQGPTGVDFGISLSLSSDGNSIVIGSHNDNPDINGNGLGAAYVFQRAGATWSQQGPKLVPSLESLRYFGFTVSMSGNGSSFLAGMPGGDPGAAFVFARIGAAWIQQGSPLRVTPGNFGNSAALNNDGSIAMVGAWNESSVYAYSLSRAIALTQQPAPVATCPTNGATFSVAASGSSPTYRWQRETVPGTDTFVNLNNGSTASWDGGNGGAIVFGATTTSMILVPDLSNGKSFSQAHAIRYRCVLTNACGTTSSDPAKLSVCAADFNCDGLIDDTDFVSFAAAYDLLICSDPAMPANCPADFNGDGQVDDSDFVLFAGAYNALLCS